MDNNGVIDMDEMAAIIETLDCIEGVKPGFGKYDPQHQSSGLGSICITKMAASVLRPLVILS